MRSSSPHSHHLCISITSHFFPCLPVPAAAITAIWQPVLRPSGLGHCCTAALDQLLAHSIDISLSGNASNPNDDRKWPYKAWNLFTLNEMPNVQEVETRVSRFL